MILATSIVWLEMGEHMLRTTISSASTGFLKCLFVMVALMMLNSRNCSFCSSKGFKTCFSLLIIGRHKSTLLKDSLIKDFCEPESKRILIFLFQSRSFANVWNTHFIIFSFRARNFLKPTCHSFPRIS